MDITVEFSDAAVAAIAKVGFDPAYGARPLKRAMQSEVEDKFAESYLEGNFHAGDTVVIGAEDGKMTFTKKEA